LYLNCYFDVVRVFNRKYLKQKRKDLRNKPSRAEAFLWGYLKWSKFEGRKFRRQTSIKSFTVNFYCPEEKLVIELDGVKIKAGISTQATIE